MKEYKELIAEVINKAQTENPDNITATEIEWYKYIDENGIVTPSDKLKKITLEFKI